MLREVTARTRAASVAAALLAFVLFAGVAAALVRGVERGPSPPAARAPARGVAASGVELSLAGSGSNLPITRKLVARFAELEPGEAIVVHESIGSGGGLRALRDGVISGALVSRALEPKETAGLRVVPYARVAVVLAAHADVAERALPGSELLELFAGTRTHWLDGRPVVLFQRERGDSSHRAVERALPAFAAIDEQAYATEQFPVAITDDELLHALLHTEGAAGLSDEGVVRAEGLSLRVLPIGSAPIDSPSYPFHKELALVVPLEPSPRLERFAGFLASEPARALLRADGYAPLPEVAP